LDDFDPLLVTFGQVWDHPGNPILPGGFWYGWISLVLVWFFIVFACFIVDLAGFVTSCCAGVRGWLWIVCARFPRLTGFGCFLRHLIVFWEFFALCEWFLCGFGMFGAAGRGILRFPSCLRGLAWRSS